MSFTDDLGKDWIEDAKQEGGEVETVEQEAVQEEIPEEPDAKEEEIRSGSEAEETKPEGKEAFDPVSHRKMMDERRKRQEAEAELIELRRQMNQQKSEAPKPVQIPDAYEQPEEFGQYLQAQMDEQRFQTRLEVNGVRAETKYGEDVVKEAVDWAVSQNDPVLGQRMRQSSTPVELVVQEYQQSRTLQAVAGRSLEDWAKDYAMQQGWIGSQGENPQPKLSSSKAPPRSLASKPGSGGVSEVAKGDAFDGVFSASGMGLTKG